MRKGRPVVKMIRKGGWGKEVVKIRVFAFNGEDETKKTKKQQSKVRKTATVGKFRY